jgi:phage terminase small subunit
MSARNNIKPTPDASRGDDGMTERKRAFVAEYLRSNNGTQSAIKAGYSAKTAQQASSRLLKDVVIRTAITAHQAAVIEKVQNEAGISLERTLREIARLAYFDPRRMFDAKGNPLAIHDLDDDTAAAVAGLDVLEEWEGSGQDRVLIGHVKKWKLADKKGALDMLMKHLGGYKADNKQTGEATAEALAEFMAGLRNSGAGSIQVAKKAPNAPNA